MSSSFSKFKFVREKSWSNWSVDSAAAAESPSPADPAVALDANAPTFSFSHSESLSPSPLRFRLKRRFFRLEMLIQFLLYVVMFDEALTALAINNLLKLSCNDKKVFTRDGPP